VTGAVRATRAPRALVALALVAFACLRAVPEGPALRVGTSGDYAPFSLERANELTGFDVEVARLFARDTDRRLVLVRFRWPDLLRDLDAGRFDVAMGGVTIRPERARAGTFTRPVAESAAVVLARPEVAASFGRRGHRLAVNAGGHLERVARERFPDVALVLTADNQMLPAIVRAGAADALLTDDLEAVGFAAALPEAVRLGPFTRDRKAYLGRDPALVADLDAWIRAREVDGTLAGLRTRWLGAARGTARTAFASDLEALMTLLDLRLAFMRAVAAAKERAGLAIEDAAQEERVLAAARAEAVAHGLAPSPVEVLFRVQIAVARRVQSTFLALRAGARPAVEPLDLEREARPALAAISRTIIARAADVARDAAARTAVDAARLARELDANVATEAERLALARAVLALRPEAR
jgi:cyclohexadienyl dehydratase